MSYYTTDSTHVQYSRRWTGKAGMYRCCLQ